MWRNNSIKLQNAESEKEWLQSNAYFGNKKKKSNHSVVDNNDDDNEIQYPKNEHLLNNNPSSISTVICLEESPAHNLTSNLASNTIAKSEFPASADGFKTRQNNDISESNAVEEYMKEVSDKKKNRRTTCKFCHNIVTNFERHLVRHHAEEKEVRDFLKLSTKSQEDKNMRRKIIALLRYETQFEAFVQSEKMDPNKLPCAHCKRLIAVKYLTRHYKVCAVKPINVTGRKIQHRIQSQTLVARASESANTTATLRVRKEVFSKMKADEISLVAKRDPLIRHFGENYLKKHKHTQTVYACSNKLRECARLLIEVRRRIGRHNLSFFDMLRTSLFDVVAASGRSISGYDEQNRHFTAPSLAMHLGTLLKQVCDLCTNLLLKDSSEFKCENTDARLKEIKRLKLLIDSQWAIQVSALAMKDLAEKKCNKPGLLPLTKDIIKFRNHILQIAEQDVTILRQDGTNEQSFRRLVDSSLSLTILFNPRIGVVQCVSIDSYLKDFTTTDQTEYMEELTESEKLLTQTYKRVVADGKGSRPIVIFFPTNLQKYIDLLLRIRSETNIVPEKNRYLFAYPHVTDQWVRADVAIKRFANSCNLEHPEILTSNRLQKQIATLMQIINLPKDEYPQFSKFMGHTHQDYYEPRQHAACRAHTEVRADDTALSIVPVGSIIHLCCRCNTEN